MHIILKKVFQTLPATIGGLKELSVLSIDENQLEEIPSAVCFYSIFECTLADDAIFYKLVTWLHFAGELLIAFECAILGI